MSKPEFTLELPMPPSVNNLYVGMGKNRRKHPNYSAWSQEAGWRINEAKAAGKFKALPDECWYWTDLILPGNHLGDSDNRLKAMHDLLHEMQATPDDRWLLGGSYMRCKSVKSGTCVVTAVSLSDSIDVGIDQIRWTSKRILEATKQ